MSACTECAGKAAAADEGGLAVSSSTCLAGVLR
jgi:hypothetical protein